MCFDCRMVVGQVACWGKHNQSQPILTFAIKITDFKLCFKSGEGLLLVVSITYACNFDKNSTKYALDGQKTELREVGVVGTIW